MSDASLILENEGIPEASSSNHSTSSDDGSSSIRFEDLTVDDDLPIIDRVVRYMRSSIALQRLVHVKMLAETADLAGYDLILLLFSKFSVESAFCFFSSRNNHSYFHFSVLASRLNFPTDHWQLKRF
jgi:hypothetical protein